MSNETQVPTLESLTKEVERLTSENSQLKDINAKSFAWITSIQNHYITVRAFLLDIDKSMAEAQVDFESFKADILGKQQMLLEDNRPTQGGTG